MTKLDDSTSTTDWVIDHPPVLQLFQDLNIDYCCGGKSLEFACQEKGLDPEIVLQRILALLQSADHPAESITTGSIPQPIIGYHLDDEDYWVAELACGHNQHVRHNPPWTIRAWTTTAAGRNAMIGFELQCKKCAEGAPRDFHG